MTTTERLFSIDVRSLKAFRIGLGALLLADLAYRALDFSAHYTDSGVLPRNLHREIFGSAVGSWSLHLLDGDAALASVLFLLSALAASALLLGYRPRLAALLSWVLLVSVQNRQPLIVHGGDMILRLLLFWSILLPLPTRTRSPRAPQWVLSPASAALLLQVGLIYFFSVFFKLQSPSWTELTGVRDALAVEGVATRLGSALLDWPALLRVLALLTLALEAAAALLVFVPWRTSAIRTVLAFVMIAFHTLGLGGTMHLGLFEYVMAVAWIPFLPASFWERWNATRSSLPTTRLRHSAPISNGLAVACLFLVLADCAMALDRSRFRDPAWQLLKAPIRSLALAQGWRLWAKPLRNRYYVFPACLEDGSRVDLHTGRALDWDQPRRRSRNNHWWKYQLHALGDPRGRRLLPTYALLLMREWERDHPRRPVTALALVRIDATHPGRDPSELPRRVRWQVEASSNADCFVSDLLSGGGPVR